ncbi:MAG: hypothetical protein IPJ77_06340 [Planctomycetes bacterium]|nr:hypothetical protein [Planctomycetota bacterium]
MKRRVLASLFPLLVCAGAPAAAFDERALGLVAAPTGREVADPRFVAAETDLVLAPGDALVARVDSSRLRAGAAGFELGFAEGERVLAVAPPDASGWTERRVDLGAHAGRRLRSIALVAHDLAAGPGLLRVDALAIARADGSRVELEPERPVVAREPALRAALVSVAAGELADGRARPLGGVRDPWAALDLSTLRKRIARQSGKSSTASGTTHGLVLAGDGVPLWFADADEPASIAARAQRLSLEPLDGGSFYTLYAAVTTASGEPIESTWRVVGTGGEEREVRVAIPARDPDGVWQLDAEQGFPDVGCVVLEIPLASPFPLASVQLPDDERIELLAATVAWCKDAANDARFRRAWMQRERPGDPLARYVRALRLDGAFGARRDESAHERELFRRLLQLDGAGFDRLLAERLVALDPSAAEWRTARVAFATMAPALDAGLENAEWERAALARERDRLEAFTRYATTRGEAPDGRTLLLLAERAPDVLRALGELARAKRIEPAPVAWTHDDWGLVGEGALAHELALARDAFARSFGPLPAEFVAWAPQDLGWFRQWPQAASTGGASALVSAPIDWSAVPRPLVCLLRAPDQTELALLTPPSADAPGRRAGLLAVEALGGLLDQAARRNGARELLVPLVTAGADDALERENRRRQREIVQHAFGPRARSTTFVDFLAEARKAPGFTLPAWRANKDGERAPELATRSDELHAWTRKAENRLVDAGAAGALAAADGHVPILPLYRALWERVLANHAAAERLAARGASSATRIADAREVAGAADALLDEAARVLSLAADTQGLGQAVFVFNPLAFARTTLVSVTDGDFEVQDPLGRVLPSQRTPDGKRVFEASVPSLGYAVHRLVPRAVAKGIALADPPSVRVDGWKLVNAEVQCAIDPETGAITTLRRRADGVPGQETLREGARLELVGADGTVTKGTFTGCELVEAGPVRARVRSTYVFGTTRVEQELVLRASSPSVEAKTRVEGALAGSLRVVFDVVKPRDAAPRHVPFGYGAVRADESARSGLLSWVSQGDGFGVALASEDAAACGTHGSRVWLWLADPEEASSARAIRWSCLPFEGSEQDGRLMAFGQEAGHAARAFAVDSHPGVRPARHAFLEVGRISDDGRLRRGAASNVIVTELVSASDGAGWCVRLFDASGLAGDVELDFDRPIFAVRRADLGERVLGEPKAEPKRVVLRVGAWRIESVRLAWKP